MQTQMPIMCRVSCRSRGTGGVCAALTACCLLPLLPLLSGGFNNGYSHFQSLVCPEIGVAADCLPVTCFSCCLLPAPCCPCWIA